MHAIANRCEMKDRLACPIGPALGVLVVAAICASGCGGRPGALSMPSIDPDVVAREVIAASDADGDGVLRGGEVNSPSFGLRFSARKVDADGDRAITESEVRDYVQAYWLEAGGAVINAKCKVVYKNRAVRDAVITFEPVDYLKDVIKPASGVTRGGLAKLDMSDEDRPHKNAHGVNCGLYVVRISTQGGVQIPARYNTESVLACEVAPRAGYMPGPIVFNLN